VLGILLRLVDPDRHCFAVLSQAPAGTQVAVWGRTRYSRAPGREQRRLMQRIRALEESDSQ